MVFLVQVSVVEHSIYLTGSHPGFWNLACQSSDSHIYFHFRFALTLVVSPGSEYRRRKFFWTSLLNFAAFLVIKF